MIRHLLSILLVSLIMQTLSAQHKPSYQLYSNKGKKVDYGNMLEELKEADIVLFGELHNNPICHWLQIELTSDLSKSKKKELVLGAEMFEADDQLILNEYLSGKVQEKHLKAEAKVWSNYATDYAPLVNFAQSEDLKFIATNVPRRYASLVAREGLIALDSLTEEAKTYMAPLPIKVDMQLPGYKNMLSMMGGHGGAKGEQFVHAQAIKDATMAHFILKNWQKGNLFLHYNGAYHSNNYEGIVWYLKQQNPDLKVMTITSVEQDSVSELEDKNKKVADYMIVIPASMTKTY